LPFNYAEGVRLIVAPKAFANLAPNAIANFYAEGVR